MPRKPSCLCGTCPRCKHRAYMRSWYQAKSPEERKAWVAQRNPEKVRAADRARYERDKPKRLKAMAAYSRANPEKVAAAKKRWIERNPEKRKAHDAVAYAVRSGKLVRQPCEVCGATGRIHAHHDDYTKPLEVRWLCRNHHAEKHSTPRIGSSST